MSPKKLVPEGIEGRVPYKGPVADVLFQMVGGLRSGMGYVRLCDIDELRTETEFVRDHLGGLRESHPHDVHHHPRGAELLALGARSATSGPREHAAGVRSEL